MKADSTAIISPEAEIADNVIVGAYCVIEGHVKIGKNTKISPYVHIKGNTVIGEGNLIHSGCIIGEKPQMLGLKEETGKLVIGSNNTLREYVTIHTSTKEDGSTSIGDNNYLMVFSHIAHDCSLKNNITISNGSLLAGHVEIEDNAIISGNSAVQQFVRIGRLVMIGGLSRVTQDIPPFMMCMGNSKIWGINTVGLKRAGITSEEIRQIKKAYRILYRERLPVKKSIEKLEKINSTKIQEIVTFIKKSKRGIAGANRSTVFERIFLNYPFLIRQEIESYRIFKKKR